MSTGTLLLPVRLAVAFRRIRMCPREPLVVHAVEFGAQVTCRPLRTSHHAFREFPCVDHLRTLEHPCAPLSTDEHPSFFQ